MVGQDFHDSICPNSDTLSNISVDLFPHSATPFNLLYIVSPYVEGFCSNLASNQEYREEEKRVQRSKEDFELGL
ncbi:hypothetical protein M8C21_001276 [Ambrosia artemisiifolia]|uniref:Uncharacterized protein n=1 Tax=Ambrosia artemisiifolia TaxID=4212 RepID=A0AAD5GBJ2_AMBAR|nr:hypothetical protein M8C21_001276 [Ambrosia artemisiifolia]